MIHGVAERRIPVGITPPFSFSNPVTLSASIVPFVESVALIVLYVTVFVVDDPVEV